MNARVIGFIRMLTTLLEAADNALRTEVRGLLLDSSPS